MSLVKKIKKLSLIAILATTTSFYPSQHADKENKDTVQMNVCVEHSENLTQQEKRLTTQSFNLAQRKARKQGLILEPTNRDQLEKNEHGFYDCNTLLYEEAGSYLDTDTTNPYRFPNNEQFYAVEQSHAQENSQLHPRILTSLGRVQRDTARVSVTKTLLVANNTVPSTYNFKQELRENYLAYVTLHELGHSAGLLHPEGLPNISNEERIKINVYNSEIPGVMGHSFPHPTPEGVKGSKAYAINETKLDIIQQGLDEENILYHLIRAERGLSLVQGWYKHNVDSTMSRQYIGFTEENHENLPPSLVKILEEEDEK